MNEKRILFLVTPEARKNAHRAIDEAVDGSKVTIGPPGRSLGQSAKFHGLCTALEKSQLVWFGKRRSKYAWKVLMISGHAKHLGDEVELVQGLEGEIVNVRESEARMSKTRESSLIEYVTCFMAQNGIECNKLSCL